MQIGEFGDCRTKTARQQEIFSVILLVYMVRVMNKTHRIFLFRVSDEMINEMICVERRTQKKIEF